MANKRKKLAVMNAVEKEDMTSAKAEPTTLKVALPQNMSIETVDVLVEEFRQLPMTGKSRVNLDAAGLEHITTAGLQIIVSLEKTITSDGGVMAIDGVSQTVRQAFMDTGLQRLIT